MHAANGRRASLRHWWQYCLAGSNPAASTLRYYFWEEEIKMPIIDVTATGQNIKNIIQTFIWSVNTQILFWCNLSNLISCVCVQGARIPGSGGLDKEDATKILRYIARYLTKEQLAPESWKTRRDTAFAVSLFLCRNIWTGLSCFYSICNNFANNCGL